MLSGDRPTGRLVVALITALLLVSTAAGPVVAAQETPEEPTPDDVEPADEVYITDDGAVLVYENETNDTASSEVVAMNYGGDVATGLVDGVVTIEDNETENVTGTLGLEAREDSLSGDANLSFNNTDDVGEFTFTAEGEHTADDSYFNSEFEGKLETGPQSVTGETNGAFIVR